MTLNSSIKAAGPVLSAKRRRPPEPLASRGRPAPYGDAGDEQKASFPEAGVVKPDAAVSKMAALRSLVHSLPAGAHIGQKVVLKREMPALHDVLGEHKSLAE